MLSLRLGNRISSTSDFNWTTSVKDWLAVSGLTFISLCRYIIWTKALGRLQQLLSPAQTSGHEAPALSFCAGVNARRGLELLQSAERQRHLSTRWLRSVSLRGLPLHGWVAKLFQFAIMPLTTAGGNWLIAMVTSYYSSALYFSDLFRMSHSFMNVW